LEGGILGRIDDMFTVRGNNVFPNAIEAVIRRFTDVSEFRVTVRSSGALANVSVEIEPAPSAASGGDALAKRVAAAMQESLSFRADVSAVAPGALPRFEMKAKRFIRTNV
jgi:phenylacetate-CoA ligase